MPAQLQGELRRLQEYAREMSVAQRVFAALLAAMLVVGVVFMVQWSSRPSMAPLFTGLAADDAAAIVEQLDSSGIPYELTAGGGTIMVPQAQLYDTRLAVASAGLPNGTASGYALLDDMSMTSSEFQQEVTYQRALEGELAATISAMDGVTTASVKLALPEDTVFVSEQQDPTASVFVETAAGRGLAPSNVQAIIHLVSASIEGMDPESVAVIDANGVVLSTVGGQTSILEQSGETSEYESRVASSIQAMLDRVVGAGNAVVAVTAELDYDKTATTSETFTSDPDAQPLSESTSLEEYTGTGGATDAGVLGPDNISVPNGDGTEGEYRREETVSNNAVNKVTEVTESAPGQVRRQSVSVVANSAAAAAIDLADLRAMVAAAAGVDEERGDVVNVSVMNFDSTAADAAESALAEAAAATEAAAERAMFVSIAQWAAIGLAVIVIVVVLLIVGRRRRRNDRMELSLEAVEELEQRAQAALEARTQAVLDAAGEAAADPALALEAAPVPTMDDVAIAIRDEIATFAAQQPAEVAEVLRGWIGAGRNS